MAVVFLINLLLVLTATAGMVAAIKMARGQAYTNIVPRNE